jgi:ABC-type branched-subunit amino acid transport system ATPase component
MSADPLIISNLQCAFSGVVAVDGVSLSCSEGKITGIIGPNGAGKSTLLACVAGMTRAQAGSIQYRGKEVRGLPSHRVARLGVVRTFQLANVFPRLTVMENLLVGSNDLRAASLRTALKGQRFWRRWESDALARGRGLLERFGLKPLEGRYAGDLSGGEKRLVEIMRALMYQPSFLLLDEPMAGVNPTLALQLGSYLRELASEGLTMLMVEHELGYVESLCEKVVVMAQGRVIAAGTMQEIRANPEVIDVYLAG